MIPVEYTKHKRIVHILLLIAVLLIAGCRPSSRLPARGTREYTELVRTFYVGLAALQVGHDVQADTKLSQFTQLAASEPAGWANWGLLALRQRNFDTASERLERARSLAPDNDDIQYLLGLLESSRGKSAEAIAALRRAVELDANNLFAVYKLAEEVERQGDEQSSAEVQSLVQKILNAQPDNLAALVELSRIAAKRGDGETLKSTVAKIQARSSSWPTEVQEQVKGVDEAARSGDLRAAATRTSFCATCWCACRNIVVIWRRSNRPGEEAIPFEHFLVLESPVFTTAAPDTALTFKPEPPAAQVDLAKRYWVGAIALSGEGAPVVAQITSVGLDLPGTRMPFPAGAANTPPHRRVFWRSISIMTSRSILVLAGAGGVRFIARIVDRLLLMSAPQPNYLQPSSTETTSARGQRTSRLTEISTWCSIVARCATGFQKQWRRPRSIKCNRFQVCQACCGSRGPTSTPTAILMPR